jgi:hypothetical protein
MREKQEVMEKFFELKALKLKERREQLLCMMPKNCFFNCRLRVKGNSQVGFCQNPKVLDVLKVRVFVCNDEEIAKTCRRFVCRHTEESVRSEFDKILQSPSRCGQEYPKLAMLIWFLQDFDLQSRLGRFKHSLVLFLKSLIKFFLFKWW